MATDVFCHTILCAVGDGYESPVFAATGGGAAVVAFSDRAGAEAFRAARVPGGGWRVAGLGRASFGRWLAGHLAEATGWVAVDPDPGAAAVRLSRIAEILANTVGVDH